MFDNLVESSAERKNARTLVFLAGTAVVWIFGLFSIIVGGIMLYDAQLNADFAKLETLVAAPPPPPPPPPPPSTTAPQPKVTPTAAPAFQAVKEAPKEITPPKPTPVTSSAGQIGGVAGGVVGGEEGGEIGGVEGGVVGGTGVAGVPPPPPPPDVEPPKPPSIQRVSAGVLAGKAVARPTPNYPPMAKAAGIEGTVVVEVTVSESGAVISAKAVSGHPMLRDAAVGAARGWRFSPTLLSGTPVKVVGTIAFNFKKP